MCLSRKIELNLPTEALVYKVMYEFDGMLDFPIFSSHSNIEIEKELDADIMRPFLGINEIPYEFTEGGYPNGFHTFKFLDNARTYKDRGEVIFVAKASEIVACGEFHTVHDVHVCFVSKKLKLLHRID
jgi:hypothetical protein